MIVPEAPSRYEEVIAAGKKRKGLPRLQLPAGPSEQQQQNMNTDDLSPKIDTASLVYKRPRLASDDSLNDDKAF